MKISITKRRGFFGYLKGMNWQRETRNYSYLLMTSGIGYKAVDTDNRLEFTVKRTEYIGISSDYTISIGLIGSEETEEIEGSFAKKVFNWVLDNTYVVEDVIDKLEEEQSGADKELLAEIIKSILG